MSIPEEGLRGVRVRLEPMTCAHVGALTAAAGADRESYPWSAVPIGLEEMERYVSEALAARDAGTAVPLVTVRAADAKVLGATRFFLLERWSWPPGHPRAAQQGYDGCEIGYTWLTPAARRTAANTEAKLLMLRHAFESWDMHRVCLHTDARNERSRNAMLRIGAKFDGVLRAHRLATDLVPRDSARYSIIASEWPRVKSTLEARLAVGG
jgi:RimJ/RimL family protein N-acetyltransferase